jgi:hypothetical protein
VNVRSSGARGVALGFIPDSSSGALMGVGSRHWECANPLKGEPEYMSSVEKVKNVAGMVTAIIGVPAALFALLFLLFPNLIPWTSLRVDISEPSIEHNAIVEDVSQREYLDPGRSEENADLEVKKVPPSSFKPQTLGNVVSYRLEMEGFARRTVRVYWSLHEESGQRVTDKSLTDQLGWPSNDFQANRRVNVVSGDAFVPLPKADGTYFVKLGVWDGLGVRMDIVDSPKFEIVQGRSKEVPPDSGSAK